MQTFQTFKSNVTDGPITLGDVRASVAGLFLGGPIGAVLSPVVYRGFQRRLAPWALVGTIAAGPLSVATVAMFGGDFNAPTTASVEQVIEAPAVEAPAPVVVAEVDEPEFKYDWEESRAQYKWFYNFYRNSGMGHSDARSLAEEQLREQGFDYTVVTNTFARDVRLAY